MRLLGVAIKLCAVVSINVMAFVGLWCTLPLVVWCCCIALSLLVVMQTVEIFLSYEANK